MKTQELKSLIRECLSEVITEMGQSDVDQNNFNPPEQEFSSAKTSRKQVPTLHRLVVKQGLAKSGDLILDFGGGKFDDATEFIESSIKGTKNLVYDPFNRDDKHNNAVLAMVDKNGGADVALNANVLNVIKEKSNRLSVIKAIHGLLKSGGKLLISVYAAAKSKEFQQTDDFVGQKTKDGWQNAQPLDFYLEEIQQFFPNAVRKGQYIIAKK
jgi:hypothetical protein